MKQKITYPDGETWTLSARTVASHAVVVKENAGGPWLVWDYYLTGLKASKEAAYLASRPGVSDVQIVPVQRA